MTDIEIASTVKLKPITEIAKKLGIDPEVIELYGKYKAKLPLDLIQPARMQGKHLILVSAISRLRPARENDHIDRIDRRAEPDR